MSLFDTIQFSHKLPLPQDLGELTAEELQSSNFQTKSLDCGMTFYKVDESGQLFRERFEGEWEPGDSKAKSLMSRIGYFKRTKEWFEPENYTGTINFYESIRCDKNKNDYWIEYDTVFIKGKLSDIKLTKFEATNNTDRKQRSAEFAARMKADYEWRNRWYIKYTYVPYSKLIRWIFRTYNNFLMKLPSQWKVERFLTPW